MQMKGFKKMVVTRVLCTRQCEINYFSLLDFCCSSPHYNNNLLMKYKQRQRAKDKCRS